jgi:hypothetical protein
MLAELVDGRTPSVPLARVAKLRNASPPQPQQYDTSDWNKPRLLGLGSQPYTDGSRFKTIVKHGPRRHDCVIAGNSASTNASTCASNRTTVESAGNENG